MTRNARLQLALASSLMLGAALAHPSHADEGGSAGELAERVERVAAEGLVIEGLAAILVIEGQDRDDIELTLRGTERALGRIEHEVRGGVLHLGARGGVTSVTGGAHNVVIAQDGGRASVAIGEQEVTVRGERAVIASTLEAEPMPEIRIEVPELAPLVLAGLLGEVEVLGAGGPVELGLDYGHARLDRMRDGRLRVGGEGAIEVGEASGDLAIEVQGAGEVGVRHARLEELEVEIVGTGEVTVGGSAEEGRLSVTGVGRIQVSEIRTRPEIARTGLGRIEVGNW